MRLVILRLQRRPVKTRCGFIQQIDIVRWKIFDAYFHIGGLCALKEAREPLIYSAVFHWLLTPCVPDFEPQPAFMVTSLPGIKRLHRFQLKPFAVEAEIE